MKYFTRLLIILLLFAFVQACSDSSTGPDLSLVPPPFDTTQALDKTTFDNGLVIYTIEEGHGPFEVISRDQVEIFFTGRQIDGTVFDSSFRDGSTEPEVIQNLTPVDQGSNLRIIPNLIEGFRLGIIGMKEGEKRTVVVPPELGFGESMEGTNGFDLRNDTLIFDIELEEIISP